MGKRIFRGLSPKESKKYIIEQHVEPIINNNIKKKLIISLEGGGEQHEIYRGLFSLQNTSIGKRIFKELLSNLEIGIDNMSLKDAIRNSRELRKTIKETDIGLLKIIDNPEFLKTYSYITAGFDITTAGGGKNDKNSIYELVGFLRELIKNEKLLFTGFLCAHRENDKVEENALSQSLNRESLNNAINLLRGIAKSLDKKFTIELYHIDGDEFGINATFPKVFFKHFEKGELYKMAQQLQNHFIEIQEEEFNKIINGETNESLKIIKVNEHVGQVISKLEKTYGCNRGDIKKEELIALSEGGDRIAQIALKHTLPDIQRLGGIYKTSPNDLKRLIDLNIKNAEKEGFGETIKKAIKGHFNKHSHIGLSLYETVFYYLWGKAMKERGGIGVGFDRGHESYQSEAVVNYV